MFNKRILIRRRLVNLSLFKNCFKKAFSSNETIFDKIIRKEIPSDVVYEDEKVLVFKDVNPVAPTHFLIIPKKKDGLTGISQAQERHVDVLGHIMITAAKLGKILNIEDGYRLIINEGKNGGQTVHHLHVHFIAGVKCTWPPGIGTGEGKYKL